MPPLRQIIHIGRAHRANQQLVADRPPVDEEILRLRIGFVPGRQASIAFEPETFPRGFDQQRIGTKFFAQNIGEPCQQGGSSVAACGKIEARGLRSREGKAHVRIRHREALHDVGAGTRLRAVAFEEFQPRRSGGEEIADLDFCSRRITARREGVFFALIDADRKSVRRACHPRKNIERRDGADRRQGLAAKTQRRNLGEITVGQFRRRMALDGEFEISAPACRCHCR